MAEIHDRIIELLKAHPDGLSEGEMRRALKLGTDEMAQFGRRRRDLYRTHNIAKRRVGEKTVYVYMGPRAAPLNSAQVDLKTRALVLRAAHGRCGMCGRTIEKHGVSLVVDHRLPRDWGGGNEPENLWAICEACNQGKKNLFASLGSTSPEVRRAIRSESVHVRIGELLKGAPRGAPVPSYLIGFVANQSDWRKRLRELRYLGWEVSATRKKLAGGRVESFYRLHKFNEWPPDPTGWISAYEKERAKRNSQNPRPRA